MLLYNTRVLRECITGSIEEYKPVRKLLADATFGSAMDMLNKLFERLNDTTAADYNPDEIDSALRGKLRRLDAQLADVLDGAIVFDYGNETVEYLLDNIDDIARVSDAIDANEQPPVWSASVINEVIDLSNALRKDIEAIGSDAVIAQVSQLLQALLIDIEDISKTVNQRCNDNDALSGIDLTDFNLVVELMRDTIKDNMLKPVFDYQDKFNEIKDNFDHGFDMVIAAADDLQQQVDKVSKE